MSSVGKVEEEAVTVTGPELEGGEVGPMFTGTYTPKLDEKGRLFLPAKFRDDRRRG